jgi:GntR family transcriptional repressor for pyruvate dehydrogenase complex
MFFPIEVSDISELISNSIKNLIIEGKLKPGDKLPSERILAEKFNVSRNTLREALGNLRLLGIIETKRNDGNFVSLNLEKVFIEMLKFMFLLKGTRKDVFIFRKSIEVEVTIDSVKNFTDEDLLELSEKLEKFKNTPEKDYEEIAKLDMDFHFKLISKCENYLMFTLYKAIYALITEFLNDSVKIMDKKLLDQHHEEMFNYAKVKDIKQLKKSLENHLEVVQEFNFERN